jgi:catechol 2,3-dioxygenase-like lactoylglutathione lyase family enzyme
MLVKDTIFSYPVRDLAKMTDFYREVLGFHVEEVGGDNSTTLCSGHARITIYPVAHCKPMNTHLMLVVDNLDEVIAELNVGRCEVTGVYPELHLAKFKDPEGNEMFVFEQLHVH